MATVELNACRNELARDILATDDLDVLRTTRRAYRRAMQRRNLRMMELEKMNAKGLAPYTMDELNARIDEAEAEKGGTSSEEFLLRWKVKCLGYASRMEETGTT